MPILKVNDFVGFYRHLATSSDIHVLSGRGDDVTATEFVNLRILEALELAPDDDVLDIGCGDGSLLKMASGRVARRVGIVPNVEEQSSLQGELPDISFRVGLAQSLPVESDSFSKTVCNSVLLLLDSEDLVRCALREIARVARRGGRIWVGEIPEADELARLGKYKGNSIAGFLWHSFTKDGAKGFLGSGKAVLEAVVGGQTLVLNSAGIFHASPEEFISMAQQCGLRQVSHFKHLRLDRSGKILESPYRYNYIFVK